MTWLEELRQRDPDRAGAALLAPMAARPRLLTLAALNAELARIPRASADPLLTEIRAQWWVEALERAAGGAPGETPLLRDVARAWGTESARLVPLAEGWREACALEADAGLAAILAHLDATAGEAAWQAARVLDAAPAEAPIRAQGRGTGAVAWLRAGGAGGPALAEAALEAFATAAAAGLPRRLAPALYPGPAPGAALIAAAAGQPVPRPSEFTRRLSLLRFAVTGHWQVQGRR